MELPRIVIGDKVLSRLDDALQMEWLVTNGLGGYSSSTVLGLNTRKYHGLLVAALDPPGKRTVCLAKLDEDIIIGDNIYRLGANEFHEKIFPQGYTFIKEFTIAPFPTFTYEAEKITVKKTAFMPHNRNVVVVLYDLLNASKDFTKIRFFPILSNRRFHTVIDHSKEPVSFRQEQDGLKVRLTFNDPKVTITLNATAGNFVEQPNWVERLHYREESARGEIDTDDCYQPGYYELLLEANKQTRFAFITVANEDERQAEVVSNSIGSKTNDIEQLLVSELARRSIFLDGFYGSNKQFQVADWLRWVALATDTFVARNANNEESVIAGYFWFEPWGRDTFISLPGLLLTNRRFDDAKHVLLNFSNYIKKGLIPNIILDESGQPLYNTVDGTLWYINALLQYLKYTDDFEFVKHELWDKLKSIIENHEKGTDYNIQLNKDGLISHGSRLTWMDACIEGEAVTPRAGKAVEIQALWYNALKIMQLLANRFEEKNLAEKYDMMAQQTNKSFNEKFWNAEKGCLFDVIEENTVDLSLRPNQIIAASLDFTMLDNEKNERIVDFVQREFLTPFGLRTLSPNDPRYKGIYSGVMKMRDQAYHNGAVWPWLIGPFSTAFLKAKGYNDKNRGFILKNVIQALFEKKITIAGLGQISEIFDGDPPHTPRGCIAQAWSVAEPLRVYVEDIMQVKPAYEEEI